MNAQQLLDAGYKKINTSVEYVEELFQKTITDHFGVKYVINVSESKFGDYSRFDATIQLQCADLIFNVEVLYLGDKSVNQLEQLIESIWYNIGCSHYEEKEE